MNTYARLECQDYKGPFLDEELAKYPKVGEDSGSALHRDVVGKLEAVFGSDKFFLSNVKLDCGYFIGKEKSPIAVNSSSGNVSYSLIFENSFIPHCVLEET